MDNPCNEEEERFAERVQDAGRYFQPPFLFLLEAGTRQAMLFRVSEQAEPHDFVRCQDPQVLTLF